MSDSELARFVARDEQGFGCLSHARGRLPLTAMSVSAKIRGLICELELTQTFENTFADAIEATYTFPLPDRAAVNRFRMEVGGRTIEGIIDERGRARADYEQAIAAGHRAALAEEDRAGVFTLQVGNLAPRDVAKVRLTLVGPVSIDAGEATFQFPLVVAPRYIPGEALPGPSAGVGVERDTDAVPDASRISPPVLLRGFPNPVRLSISASIEGAGLRIGAPRSSLHAVSSQESGGGYLVRLEPGERLDRDFILRWSVGADELGSSASLTPDHDGEGATLSVTLAPALTSAPARPRDVVFLLDRSGSMDGWKMVAARRAVARMVDTLNSADRFQVTAFSNFVESPKGLSKELEVATDRARFRAVEFLSQLEVNGGTEMREPLLRAAELLSGGYEDRERVLVLVTDGQVGNEDQILRELGPRLKNVRVFTLGIDRAVNAAFLRRLAGLGGGACELCESEDRLDEVMTKLHRRIGTPLLTEINVSAEGIDIDFSTRTPERAPALFAGAPLLLAMRSKSTRATGAVIVTGRTPGGQSFSQRIELTAAAPSDAAAAIWARAHIRDLEDAFVTAPGGRRSEIERRIVATSCKHRVLSRFTAFLAVDRSEVTNPDGEPRVVVQPVQAPSGWDSMAVGSLMPSRAPMPAAPAPMAAAAPPPPMAGAAPMARSTRGSRGVEVSGAGGAGDERARKLRSRVPQREAPAAESVTADAGPYLKRVAELAEALTKSAAANDLPGFDLVVARLHELVEDLKSIGGFDELASALERVAAEFGDALAAGRFPASEEIEALRRLAREGAPSAEKQSRWSLRSFWK